MFSLSEGPQQSAPTAVVLAAAVLASNTWTGTRVFPAVSSKGLAEAPTSSAGAASAAVPAAAPATGGTVFPTASVGGGGQGARFCRWNSGIVGSTGDHRYCSLGWRLMETHPCRLTEVHGAPRRLQGGLRGGSVEAPWRSVEAR